MWPWGSYVHISLHILHTFRLPEMRGVGEAK